MKYPLTTVGALIFNKNRILFLKTHKWKGQYGLPAGKLHYGEDLIKGLKREIKEETGLEVYDIKFLLNQEIIEPKDFFKKAHFVSINHTCKTKNTNVKLNREAQSYRWVTAENALKLNLNNPTKELIEYYLKSDNKISINYDNFKAKNFAKYRKIDEKLVKKIIKYSGIKKGARIVDIGTGTGEFLYLFNKLVKAKVVGIDNSSSMLSFARKRVPIGTKLIKADIRKSIKLNQKFDFVFMSSLYQHIRKKESVLNQCKKLLKKNGKLLIFGPVLETAKKDIIVKLFPSIKQIDKKRFDSINQLNQRLRKLGFNNIIHIGFKEKISKSKFIDLIKSKAYTSALHMINEKEYWSGMKKLKNLKRNIIREQILFSARRN